MSKINKYISTVRYLRFSQAVNRIFSKLIPRGKAASVKLSGPVRNISVMIPVLDCDAAFVSRFSPDGLKKKEVTLLNKKFVADYTTNARKVMKPLYRFNLYYFEYAVALGAEYKRTGNSEYIVAFTDLYKDYLDAKVAMHPYVISLHIPNILIALDFFGDSLDAEFLQEIHKELYSQYKYLLRHLEKHLLANHYFENLKAVVIASYFFREDNVCKRYMKKLYGQVKEQVLSDGVHFELSPMYHKIILEDLLRIAKLSENEDFPKCEWLKPEIKKMLDAMASMEKGFGRTPLFNDSGDNVAKSASCLEKACKDILGISPTYKNSLASSGYYKLYDGDIAVMVDVGKIGPDYNPGHGHCDCLSFELCFDGNPLFVNAGTYEYQGDMRKYFRSTRAHNTLMIGTHEQSECWGEHRVARRIKNVFAENDGNTLIGEFKNYLGEKHKRILNLEERAFTVMDFITSTSEDTVSSYLHLAEGFSFVLNEGNIDVVDKNGKKICKIVPQGCEVIIDDSELQCVYAPEFGMLQKSECLKFMWMVDKKQHGYKIIFSE